MTPAEFRALTRPAVPVNPRAYRAMTEASAPETFLTLHMGDGKCHSLAYSQLALISADERGGTVIRMNFRTAIAVIRGRQLQSAIEAIRARRAAHLYEFDGEKYDQPEPGAPIVQEIAFETERARAAAGAST